MSHLEAEEKFFYISVSLTSQRPLQDIGGVAAEPARIAQRRECGLGRGAAFGSKLRHTRKAVSARAATCGFRVSTSATKLVTKRKPAPSGRANCDGLPMPNVPTNERSRLGLFRGKLGSARIASIRLTTPASG